MTPRQPSALHLTAIGLGWRGTRIPGRPDLYSLYDLRLRKRPPSGLEMINAGKPWSPMDMEDLFDFYETGMPVVDIADYLCRTVDEAQAKIDEVETKIAGRVLIKLR
jgi:hypothetical protein